VRRRQDAPRTAGGTTVPLSEREPVSQSSQADRAGRQPSHRRSRSPRREPAKVSAPLRDISLQVTQAGRSAWICAWCSKAARFNVSVHSGDANLTGDCGKPFRIAGPSEENGYRSECWRPATPPRRHSAPEAQASTNHSRGGGGQPQQGGSQQDSGQAQSESINQPAGRRNWNPVSTAREILRRFSWLHS